MIQAREDIPTNTSADGATEENIEQTENLAAAPGNIPPGTKVRVIVNPSSGKKGGFTTNASGIDDVKAALQEVAIEADFCETEYPGHATKLAKQAITDGYEIVIACGGDGTVSEVAKSLIGKKGVTLGILPLGSANNVAHMTGVPFDLMEAARNLRTGIVKNIDAGRCNGEYFLETAGIGLDAALFPILNKVDKGEYVKLWDAVTTLFRFRQRTLTLVLDKRAIKVRALVVLVANGPYWGYSLPLAPDALIDDHKFDVVVFRNFSKTDFIRHILAALFHRNKLREMSDINKNSPLDHTNHHKVRTYRAKRVQVLTSARRSWPVHADALPRGRTPALIEVLPGALRVITGTPAQLPATEGNTDHEEHEG